MQNNMTFRTPALLPALLLAAGILSGCSLAPTCLLYTSDAADEHRDV